MAIGDREQPEKDMDRWLRPNSFQRYSRKWAKRQQNKKDRKLSKLDPETPKRGKWKGWEW